MSEKIEAIKQNVRDLAFASDVYRAFLDHCCTIVCADRASEAICDDMRIAVVESIIFFEQKIAIEVSKIFATLTTLCPEVNLMFKTNKLKKKHFVQKYEKKV